MRQLFLFFVLGVSLLACNNNKPEQDATIAPAESKITDSTMKSSTTVTNNMPQQMPANPTTGMAQTQTITPQNITPGNTSAGLNPEHGKPGHKCEVAVGAPLNSAPTTTAKPRAANISPIAAPSQNNSIVPALQNTSISSPVKTSTAFTGKVNPAHGQPGHDCKVAVGQPLP